MRKGLSMDYITDYVTVENIKTYFKKQVCTIYQEELKQFEKKIF